MAQVGRISGPLLEANLLRQGIANGTQANLSFKNNAGDQSLLKIDVTNGRIGVDVEAPANELQISTTINTTDLLSTTAGLGNLTISANNINSDSGSIYLNAGEHIQLSNLETEQFYITDNYISTNNTNTNIDLVPNGTGTVEVQSNLNIYGALHSTNNITLEGNIIFGDTGDDSTALTDTVTFDADINSDIVPNETDTYELGSIQKNWDNIDTILVNGQLLNVAVVSVNGIDLTARPGNIFYVAKDGTNTNVGDHINGALLTIEEALSRADASTDGPVTIKIMPGVYEENLPLVVPNRVSIMGDEIRSVTIKPAAGSESKDVFHLDDSTSISKLTIKDYQFNSGNNTGYAFRFAPNAVITNRSPYIQDVTIITSGTVTSASDPRGFAQGDAGKGAWIDGAELNSASVEASMLFHSATFITPGVDAITMTNGVRVEWLNSFSYFANRGLYAVRGSAGRTSYDGSTVNYGAEVRSIGSANVYGNFGAVADGADTLMYLIQHNFGYIGAGKFADNDDSRAIQSQEVTELNSGKINFVTTNHTGGFRIGDNFFVDFETGNTTINIDTLSVNQFNALRVNTGANTTTIDGAFIETGNLIIANELIQSNTGDLNLVSDTGTINLQDNTNITGTLDISGNFSFGGALNIGGDQATDSLTFNSALDQDFNPNQHQTFALGSFAKQWLIAHLDKLETPDIEIYDNVIETKTSNADLELRASSTGFVRITDNATFSNNLTVNGTTTIPNNISITDNILPIVGDVNQTGNFSVTQDVDIAQNINVSASAQFEEILVDGNVVTTTTSNAPLELRASGTGAVNLQETVNVANDLTSRNTTATDANITLNITTDNANIGNVEVNDNYIETTNVNGNLILVADRDVIVTGTNVILAQDLTVQSNTVLQGTNITGTLVHIGAYNQTGNYNIAGELTVDNVYVEDNFITTTSSNLILAATGDINVDINDVVITNDLTVSATTSLQGTSITGTLVHIGNTNQTGNLNIAGEISNGNIIFEDNFISTTNTNSDLELRANGTGEVVIDTADTLTIQNNLTVGGTLTYQGLLTINGDVALLGNTQDGSLTVTNDFDVTGTLDISSQAQFEDVRIEDNFITTTLSNSNLELRANGTGEVLIPNNNVQVNNNLFAASISTGDINVNNDLVLDELEITDSNIEINENYISTKTSNSNLELRATGNVVSQENTTLEQNLTVNGDTTLQDTAINGTLTHVGDRTQTGNYVVNGALTTGMLTMSRPLQVGDIKISGNVVETTVSNSNLDLRANGSRQVLLQENVDIQNNLTVRNFNVDSISVANSVDLEIIDLSTDIQFEDNVITTTNSNSNLELRTAGTGSVYLQNVEVTQSSISTRANIDSTTSSITLAPTENLIVNSTTSLLIPTGTTAQRIVAQDTFLDGGAAINSASILNGGAANTVFGASDTIYNSGTALLTSSGNIGDIRFNTSDNVFESTGESSTLAFGGVYSADRQTSVTADPTSNTIRFVVNGAASPLDSSSLVGEITGEGLTIHGLQTDDVLLDNNVISTTVSNSDLDLRANGAGSLVLDDLTFSGNLIKNNSNNLIVKSTGFGASKISGTYGVVIPNGTTIVPSPSPLLGDTRWNTSTNLLETWDGTTYVTSAGVAAAITRQEFDDLLLEFTLIFG